MIRKKFPILATILALFICAGVNSQTNYRETVWLQISRDIYLAGEDISYNISLLENDTYKPSVLSKNIRIELIDENGKSIVKKNIELTATKASGIINIPANLNTGRYRVISYTNWMRNFAEDDFSSHPVRILNSNDANQDSLLLVNNRLVLNVSPYTDPNNPLLTKCSIYTTDAFNNEISTRGIILSGPEDTVMTFHTDYTGWGTSYYRTSDPDRFQIFARGFDRENIDLNLVVKESKLPSTSMNEKYGYLNIDLTGVTPGETYKVLVHRLYSWSWFDTLQASDDKMVFRIPVRDLPSGISQCTILDSNNNILFKRLWSDYNKESSDIAIKMEATSVIMGGEHLFEYTTRAYSDNKTDNYLSLIADTYLPGSKINNYLPGLPGWPANYRIPSSREAFEAWIISNSYPDKVTKAFFMRNPEFPGSVSGDITNIEYLPETRGGIFTGKIVNKNDLTPVNRKYIALSILNDNSFYSAVTDRYGRFVFTFPEEYGPRDYIMSFIEDYDPSWQVEIQDDYADFKMGGINSSASFTVEELEFLKNRLLNIKLKNVYYAGRAENKIVADTLSINDPFYGEAYINVRVEDYIRLPNLREVIFEVVPFVNIRLQKKKYIINVTGENVSPSEYPTLILFDGIAIYDYEDLLNLPPDRIKTIKAVNNFYIHGNAIFEGLIDIRSVNNDFGGLSMPQGTILSTFQLPQKEEYLPIIAEKPVDPGMPNIDDILIWKNLKPLSSGKESIYFNNNPGIYKISIYGFDASGKWHSGEVIVDAVNSF